MSLLVDLVVHVLVDVVSIALLWATNVLGDPDHGSGLCDGDDDFDLILMHHRFRCGRW